MWQLATQRRREHTIQWQEIKLAEELVNLKTYFKMENLLLLVYLAFGVFELPVKSENLFVDNYKIRPPLVVTNNSYNPRIVKTKEITMKYNHLPGTLVMKKTFSPYRNCMQSYKNDDTNKQPMFSAISAKEMCTTGQQSRWIKHCHSVAYLPFPS